MLVDCFGEPDNFLYFNTSEIGRYIIGKGLYIMVLSAESTVEVMLSGMSLM